MSSNSFESQSEEHISQEPTEAQKQPASRVRKMSHGYYEVGSEVLAKPDALACILMCENLPASIIYCNTPSETDLLEVLLRKKGIETTKLIGHVPPQKVSRALQDLRSGKISALVVTDIAAQGIDLSLFRLIVNYGIHSDPEVYLERAGVESKQGSQEEKEAEVVHQRVASFIGPLDVPHYHYLKKLADFPIEKWDFPSPEQQAQAKVENFARLALEAGDSQNENTLTLSDKVLAHKNARSIVSFLLFRSIHVIPDLQAKLDRSSLDSNSDSEMMPREDQDESRDSYRPDSRQRGGRGRGRDQDRGRGMRGSGSSYGNSDKRWGNKPNSRYNDYENTPREEERSSRPRSFSPDRFSPDRDNFNRGDFNQREKPRTFTKIHEARLYIGEGTRGGLTEQKLMDIMQQSCGLSQDQVKRVSLRDRYAFVDVPEEVSAKAIEDLKQLTLEEGSPLFVRKAITISTAKDSTTREEEGDDGEGEEQEVGGEEEL